MGATDGRRTWPHREPGAITSAASAELQITVDTVEAKPTIALTTDTTDGGAGHGSDKITSDAHVTVSGQDSGATLAYSVDGAAFAASYNSAALTDGLHELHVGVASDFVAAAKAHPGILVSSAAALRELAQQLESGGVAVEWADRAEIAGRDRFFVHDPWGNRLELLT